MDYYINDSLLIKKIYIYNLYLNSIISLLSLKFFFIAKFLNKIPIMLNNFNVNKYMYNYAIYPISRITSLINFQYYSHYKNLCMWVVYIQLFVCQITFHDLFYINRLCINLSDFSRLVEKWNHFSKMQYNFETNFSNI